MSNFKVGDAVVAVREFPGQLTRGKEYTILSISYEGWHRVRTDSGTVEGFTANAFKLATDDPLPPVPDSVYYPDMYTLLTGKRAAGGTSGLTVRRSPYMAEAISLSIDHSKWTRLDTDAALQLAHDLRRMAMDIKRKEKALCEPS